MKKEAFYKLFIAILSVAVIASCSSDDDNTNIPSQVENADFDISATTATYDDVLEQVVMTIDVVGTAGNTVPTPTGQLDGAPVLGYVFPTSLSSGDVGFGDVPGIVAMALTSHPDFDDTPLWDENNDMNYENDGVVWHPHWVLLNNDSRVEGNLSVIQFDPNDASIVLPPSNPGMPMYMDSPGFQVIQNQNIIKVVFPASAVNNVTNFNFDAVTALLRVNTSENSLPLLGVYEVYDVASGDLSLPYTIQN